MIRVVTKTIIAKFDAENAAIIGFWRMGASVKEIAEIIGFPLLTVIKIIENYKKKKLS